MEEIKTEGLGPISGVCAHFTEKTLNDRGYDRIYRNLLDGKDYRYNQMMKRGGIVCELGHPAQVSADFERTETDPEKACCVLKSLKELDDGKVFAEGVILDTPSGRILKALMPHYTPGFSSRGSYEAVDDSYAEGPDGWNQDTYVFKGFDVVLLPATEESMAAMESSDRKSKKTYKCAREALDLNEIASATDLTPEEIEKELDKLFNDKGEIEGSELVKMTDYANEKAQEEENKEDAQAPQNLDLNKEKEIKVEDSSEAQAPLESIKNDLETALAEAAKLKQENETALFNLQNVQAENARLSGELEVMTTRAEAAEKTVQDYDQIKQLSKKLIDSYDGIKDQFDSEKLDFEEREKTSNGKITELEEKVTAHEEELDDTKKQLSSAREEIKRLTSMNNLLKQENRSARESILETNALIYGIDKTALQKISEKQPISKIKSAAESLVRDSHRMKGFIPDDFENFAPIERKVEKPDYEILDDVDAELMDMFKND